MIVEDVERVYFEIFPAVITQSSLDSLPLSAMLCVGNHEFFVSSSLLATVNFLACKSALVSSNSSLQSI